jgi:hypothetical protein
MEKLSALTYIGTQSWFASAYIGGPFIPTPFVMPQYRLIKQSKKPEFQISPTQRSQYTQWVQQRENRRIV